MDISCFIEQVLFVVVLYKQRFNETKAFSSLRPLMEKKPGRVHVFLYDNSPEKDANVHSATHYYHDSANSGVSRAYNFAHVFALEKKFRFMLLMDQDSFFSEDLFESYSQAVVKHPTISVFAPVVKSKTKTYSPFRLVRGKGLAITRANPGIHQLSALKLVNSGLLVTVDVFEVCGGYDERFPLDFSDIVFCDRLAAFNLSVCLIDGVAVHEHSSVIGSAESRKRFETYLRALALYKHTSRTKVSFWLGGFPTAARLATRHRDRWFIQKFLDLRA